MARRRRQGMSRAPAADRWRWLHVVLRSAHLCAVIFLGAALLGAEIALIQAAGAVAATGLTLWGLDLWRKPQHLREVAGLFTLAKFLAVALIVFVATLDLPAFWLITVASAIVAHAPARLRHAALFGRRHD